MSFVITMGNSTPATTEAVFGSTEDFKQFYLDLDQATAAEQKICADFFALVGGHTCVNILNSSHNFQDCNYIVVNGVEIDAVDVDYSTLSTTNKGKINNFANLLKSLAQ